MRQPGWIPGLTWGLKGSFNPETCSLTAGQPHPHHHPPTQQVCKRCFKPEKLEPEKVIARAGMAKPRASG